MKENGKVRWGIIGPGKIAQKFASDLSTVKEAELYAVASRDMEKAQAFANRYGAPVAYHTYQALIEDSNIDAVYIATPHAYHTEHSIMCLNANKAVLCEKPMAMNTQDMRNMIEAAKAQKVLLMEALWTAFLPHYQNMISKIRNGEIGTIQKIEADFGFIPPYNAESRLFKKELGGGSLLDIGIYPVFLALSLLGEPHEIEAEASFFDTGVDSACNIRFSYLNGAEAMLKCSFLESTPIGAKIYGDKGILEVHPRFHEPTGFSIEKEGKTDSFDFDIVSQGFHYEIAHFCSLFNAGQTESPVMTFQRSLRLIQTLDRIREKIGLTYNRQTG